MANKGRPTKLSREDIYLIRSLDKLRRYHQRMHNELSYEKIGEKFGVSRQTILRVAKYYYPYNGNGDKQE